MRRGKLFVKLQIKGEDSFSLIEKLHKRGVYAYDITFFDKKTIISIDFVDYKKFFAISRNMCYESAQRNDRKGVQTSRSSPNGTLGFAERSRQSEENHRSNQNDSTRN